MGAEICRMEARVEQLLVPDEDFCGMREQTWEGEAS
jgi:hypothetical protein